MFLRSRGLPLAARGDAQVTDNLIATTLAIVSAGLHLHTANAANYQLIPTLDGDERV